MNYKKINKYSRFILAVKRLYFLIKNSNFERWNPDLGFASNLNFKI